MPGFQSFINGTAFDAVNAMSYNFVVDIMGVGGSGSKGYNYPGFNLSACLVNGAVTQGTSQKNGNVSMSGQTVNWSGVEGNAKLVTFAQATGTRNYVGFIYNNYDVNPPIFKLAPDFTPLSLTQVIDLVPGYGQVLQTNVPYGLPFICFHRCIEASGFNHVIWNEINVNGYWGLQFRNIQNGSLSMLATRLYIFSNFLVNTPPGGFYMYNNGAMVWHSNCLPLNMAVGTVTASGTPMAITPGGSVLVNYPWDPGFPNQGQQRFNCYSAGWTGSSYQAAGGDLYAASEYRVPSGVPPSASMGPPGWIYTDIYDAYYRQALGY